MNKKVALSLITALMVSTLSAETTEELSNAQLTEKIAKLEKKLKKVSKKLNKVKAHDAFDNVKFSIDARNSLDVVNYTYNNYKFKGVDYSGTEASNDAIFSSKLYLNMKSSPMPKLTFTGQLAMYGTWGGSHLAYDKTLKEWSESSKATDTVFRVRQAYFVYSDTFGESEIPYSFSVGRRPSSDGFLANMREGNDNPNSPLAHITNMEVDAAMVRLGLDEYLATGSFVKFIYGRAHTGGIETLYDNGGFKPYAQEEGDIEENVDFFVVLGSLYNDGQYNLMFQHASIFNTKGARTGDTKVGAEFPEGGFNKSLDAGTAYLNALSLQVDGLSEDSEFLENTTVFASIASSTYSPDSGHQLLGSTDSETGYSYWVGFTIPDMITDNGKLGFEFNYGSEYWTPMTWAEDTVIGSKVAVRGTAVEAYWNVDLFGIKNLSSQIRYTHVQHDYTPNVRCAGWVKPQEVDIEADNLRFFVRYTY